MFYAPSIVASMVAALTESEHESYAEIYSDQHKDAFGCRPRKPFPESRVEGAVEVARMSAWVEEDERIQPMREAVARYDFSRRMEFLQRTQQISKLEAFTMTIRLACLRPYPNDDLPSWSECLQDAEHYGWDYLAHECGLPLKDGAKLKAFWDARDA